MDYRTIVNLMKEMSHTELTKLEIEEEGFRIRIEKGNTGAKEQGSLSQIAWSQNAIPVIPQYLSGMYTSGQMMPAAPIVTGTMQNAMNQGTEEANMIEAASGIVSSEKKEVAAEEQNQKKLVSPMVGTFYAQPSPDKPPFVKVGDRVKKGQTICIIEAMKLMNDIESEHEGEVVKILTKNEDMVEFGQPLFLIK